jgi:hypothetical protein
VRVGLSNFSQWGQDRLDDVSRIAELMDPLINVDFGEAVGASGVSGDVRKIRELVKRIGEVYEFVLEWIEDVRCAHFVPDIAEVQTAFCKFPIDFLIKIELIESEFARNLHDIDDKIARGEQTHIKLSLDLSVADAVTEMRQALNKFRERMAAKGPARSTLG